MTTHHDLQSLYEQAQLAMCNESNTTVLTLMRRQGDQVVMQEYESMPKGGFPKADAALLHIAGVNSCDSTTLLLVPGNSGRMMLTADEAARPDRPLTPEEEKWLEVYLRLQAVAAERPRADEQNLFAMVGWDTPAPASRLRVRRRLGV